MKFRGGFRYGVSYPDSTFAMWPLARLDISREELSVVLPWRRFRFPRAAVTRLLKQSGRIAIGVQIEHTLLEQPNVSVFYTYHFGEVKARLEECGYAFLARR